MIFIAFSYCIADFENSAVWSCALIESHKTTYCLKLAAGI